MMQMIDHVISISCHVSYDPGGTSTALIGIWGSDRSGGHGQVYQPKGGYFVWVAALGDENPTSARDPQSQVQAKKLSDKPVQQWQANMANMCRIYWASTCEVWNEQLRPE